MVWGSYSGSGQTPAVSISVRDPGAGIYLTTPDGTNAFGSWCVAAVALGTYTVTIINDEPTQIARNLAITIAVGIDGRAGCPYSGC